MIGYQCAAVMLLLQYKMNNIKEIKDKKVLPKRNFGVLKQ
ncbi:hypothetical protein PI172_0579 [Prevotella intermedia]|uniref:Uncharacterized protein n=1 Tax=Prevotella intermedia TaxID=28131 RepID=A0AAD1BFC8_PREIN|nr:hypothetical protein PI172_0579 [Prevotella intermedia]